MDIVYFIKECKENEELRYSLRSLKNFPHDKVWFYGGCPTYLQPDYYVKVLQNQPNKWQNVNMMLRMACKNPMISDEFWLFNDDFFVMKKIDKPINYYNGDLYKRIVTLEDKYNGITPYSQMLRNCCKELESIGCETKNYTLHIPLLVNKKKMLEVLNMSDFPGFRSLYANYCKIGGEQMRDCKITSKDKLYKDGIYLSTDDDSFNGAVGDQIREIFNTKCKYERS